MTKWLGDHLNRSEHYSYWVSITGSGPGGGWHRLRPRPPARRAPFRLACRGVLRPDVPPGHRPPHPAGPRRHPGRGRDCGQDGHR
ncbi:hypothetical protein QCF01_14900, partial [Staphylococcus aureus]|nr:hypothetical protein [Staphylococcus aureus]